MARAPLPCLQAPSASPILPLPDPFSIFAPECRLPQGSQRILFTTNPQFYLSPQESGLPCWLRWSTICLQCGDLGSHPGSGRSPGEGNGYPLQYSCPEKPMDRGAWRATAHVVTELDTTERLQTDHRTGVLDPPKFFSPELSRYLCVLVNSPPPQNSPAASEWLPEGSDPHRSRAQAHSGELVLAPSAQHAGGSAEDQLFPPVTWANSLPRFGEEIEPTLDYCL